MGNVFSTIPATKAALKTIIDAAVTGIQVSYGDNPEQARTERIWLGPTEMADAEHRAIATGRTRLRERYVHHVMIEVSGKHTPAASEERVFELEALIADAVALNQTLNDVPNLLWAKVQGLELNTITTGERPLSEIDLRIECVADLGRT